jgi:hypothetical protein
MQQPSHWPVALTVRRQKTTAAMQDSMRDFICSPNNREHALGATACGRMLADLISDGNRAIMENSVDGSKSLN